MREFRDELALAIAKQFGGADGIAEKMRDVYESPSAHVRARTLDVAVKLISESADASEADDSMGEEDLEREFEALKQQIGDAH